MIHIEFIGVNGAGKSTLYHQCNAYLAGRLGYRPGPDKLWLRMVDDAALQPPALRDSPVFRLLQAFEVTRKIARRYPAKSQNNFHFLARAMLCKGDLVQTFLSLHAAQPGSGELPVPEAFAHWNLQYFLSLLTLYQTRSECTDREMLLLDEGFASAMARHVVRDGRLDEGLFARLIGANFSIRYLFHVKADLETCFERLALRGVPAPYQQLTSRELRAYLARREADITRVCERMSHTATRVVEVANDHPSPAAFSILKPHLDALVALREGAATPIPLQA